MQRNASQQVAEGYPAYGDAARGVRALGGPRAANREPRRGLLVRSRRGSVLGRVCSRGIGSQTEFSPGGGEGLGGAARRQGAGRDRGGGEGLGGDGLHD